MSPSSLDGTTRALGRPGRRRPARDGLGPATNYPNFKAFERQQGRVKALPRGGRWEATWAIEAHDSRDGVMGVLKEIAGLQAHARAVIHRAPQGRFSPG